MRYSGDSEDSLEHLRIDKWLWAARFFKTRAIAQQAVAGGKVNLNGERVKPAKEIRPGDELTIRIGEYEWAVAVRAVSDRRGPAAQAQRLYEESEESRTRRFETLAQRRAAPVPGAGMQGRPTKRDRRRMERLMSRD